MAADPSKELFEHVKDTTSGHHGFHLPADNFVKIPQPFYDSATGTGFEITKFMALEIVAAVVMLIVFIWFARKISKGRPPKGRFWNMVEIMLLFIRDEVARPAIGKKDADRFLPFLWTIFFFVLGCNLLGMIPWAGSPTGAFAVTGALAIMTFVTVVGAGMMKFGPVGFWVGQVPHMDLPLVMSIFIKPMVFCIEVMGIFIKHFVLAVRLLANMFAGHLVLAVMLSFIAMTAELHLLLWSGVTVASIFGATAVSLLELFVAFLQAYIFCFLSALFIGMAIHQH
ncbi:MAG: F0F1 ATP synthase subunit A [Pirellulales bacterium]|nr:F0F1 ATP synthase subunit A [Pirellulales bacterium]